MCALIFIKGRREPYEVSNEIARQVKHRWLGDYVTGAGKAEKTDIADIGLWCGEYGQIKGIELDRLITSRKYKTVQTAEGSVKFVALDYQLEKGEKFL